MSGPVVLKFFVFTIQLNTVIPKENHKFLWSGWMDKEYFIDP